MEIERIHNLIEQGQSEQKAYFMVEDCSKRALVTDKLAVPPKKRKQIYEELDLYDLFPDQNLQKKKSNEEDMTFCSKFGKENLSASIPSAIKKEPDENKIEFNLQSSVYVKADDSAEWIKLKCFDSITVNGSNSAIFFTGGPIQSSAFSIMPHMKANQYVAVAVGNLIYNNHSYNNTKEMSGIIQFWNVGPLHERKILNQSPSMEFAIYHDNGIITQMKWCPAVYPSTCHLPRLGLLAASSSNSYVYIYSVPQPDFMPKSNPTFPIYFTLPFMKLAPLFGGPSYATRKAVATCLEWDKNGERIVAGYGNGAICVWMIKVSSLASHITMKNTEPSYVIQPYLFFQASGASVASLSFAPFNNNRWLAVSSIDKVLRFFDLHDTSSPFHIVKQGSENTCIWGDTFCGVYSSPALNSMGLISLSAKDCCAESNDKGAQKGLFDSSTYVAVSENKSFHAIADMAGAVTVNFLKKIHKPLETSYLTYMIFETAIVPLDTLDLEMKASNCNIRILGSITSNDFTSDIKDTFYSEIKQESTSSSSGFCSPKHGKTIVIETTQSFDDDANLLESAPKLSSMNDFKDINNNEIKVFMNTLLHSDEETNAEMTKCSELSEDLMRYLLMLKISNQSQSSSHILPFDTSNNSAYCNSKGAKYLSERASVISSTVSDYTGDTIIYPFEPCFCDTSHPSQFKSVKLNAQSKDLGLNDKVNALHESKMHKKNDKHAFKTEFFTENSWKFPSAEVKSENSCSSEKSSSKNLPEPNSENCNLSYKRWKLRKISYKYNLFHSNDHHFTSTHSDISGKEYCSSKKSPKEIGKIGDTIYQNMEAKDNFIFKKDAIKSSHKRFDSSLCNDLESNNLNRQKPLPDLCAFITSNNSLICDKDDQQVSDRALIQSSAASDYSGDTIIYLPESYDCDKTGANNLKMEKLTAAFPSLYKSEKENTFPDTLLFTMDEKVVMHGSKSKLSEKSFSGREKCKHFFTKESVKYKSEYDTDSARCNSTDEDKNLFVKEFLISDFHFLHSEEKHAELNELPGSNKNPQELSYQNLVASFGVIFKNNLDESTNPLKFQENDIYVNYNPLSVIKTISWDPNEGSQSWLFIGGNSGIGRLVFVPDFVARIEKKHRFLRKKQKDS